MILPAPVSIPDYAALENVLLKYTGSKRAPSQIHNFHTQPITSNYGYGKHTHSYYHNGTGPAVVYKTYSRGKHTLIFQIIEDASISQVFLWQVVPKVARSYGLEMSKILTRTHLFNPNEKMYGGYSGIQFPVNKPLTNQEIVDLVNDGMTSYEVYRNLISFK